MSPEIPRGTGLTIYPDARELTRKQCAALALMALGYSYDTAAHNLGVGKATITDRLRMCRKKLHAKTTIHAVALYYEQHTGARINEEGDFNAENK